MIGPSIDPTVAEARIGLWAASVPVEAREIVWANWYGACFLSLMLTALSPPDLTLLFLAVVIGLGTAVVWMIWEIEQRSRPRLARSRRTSGR